MLKKRGRDLKVIHRAAVSTGLHEANMTTLRYTDTAFVHLLVSAGQEIFGPNPVTKGFCNGYEIFTPFVGFWHIL